MSGTTLYRSFTITTNKLSQLSSRLPFNTLCGIGDCALWATDLSNRGTDTTTDLESVDSAGNTCNGLGKRLFSPDKWRQARVLAMPLPEGFYQKA
jgi:hypothetical protein